MDDITQVEHVESGSKQADPGERSRRKTYKARNRPPFECIALLLQGGGALGAYQAGVYQALSEAHLDPDWVAGISIGGVNAAIIAGNPPEVRVEKLRKFWELITASPLWGSAGAPASAGKSNPARDLIDHATAMAAFIGAMGLGARLRETRGVACRRASRILGERGRQCRLVSHLRSGAPSRAR